MLFFKKKNIYVFIVCCWCVCQVLLAWDSSPAPAGGAGGGSCRKGAFVLPEAPVFCSWCYREGVSSSSPGMIPVGWIGESPSTADCSGLGPLRDSSRWSGEWPTSSLKRHEALDALPSYLLLRIFFFKFLYSGPECFCLRVYPQVCLVPLEMREGYPILCKLSDRQW